MRTILILTILAAGCSSAARTEGPVGPPADTATYRAGQSYFGQNNYIEYMAGSLPVVLTAPHGGSLQPATIPDRTAAACGGTATTVTDTNSRELVLAMRDTMFARFGRYPHVVISHLRRTKLDPNRAIGEAACANAEAAAAWTEFQAFVDSAKSAVVRRNGKGWYMDMHGHGHSVQRLELGYLLTAAELDQGDTAINTGAIEDRSSIRTLSRSSLLSFAQLLRGSASLGTLYAEQGFPAVPSGTMPGPAGAEYFNGGYNTSRHACSLSGTVAAICGVQIESNFTGVRDNAVNRARFAAATAIVLANYLKTHWALDLNVP